MAQVSFASPSRAFARLIVYVGFTMALIPVQAVCLALRLPLARRLPQWYHRQCTHLLGLALETHGEPTQAAPALFVCNHASYFDITVLGALLPASFVAKAEVGRWPFFGLLAKLQRTVFVDRDARRAVDQRDEMSRRLTRGDRLILFAEATSSDGNRVLPFKSALLSVAEQRPGGKPLTVQPVSVAYTKLDGLAMGRYLRPFVAWYGDMDLAGHMWTAAGLGTIGVEVTFHEPVTIDDLGSRKALAGHCQREVARGVAEALSGRPQGGTPADRRAA